MSTIGQEILVILDSGPKSMSELYEGVRGKRASIDKARQRLLKQGKIERVDHGVYQKSARPRVEIDFSELSEEEKSNHELNHIGDMIDQTCELVDKIYHTAGYPERLEILENLLQSAANLLGSARSVYLAVESELKAEYPADVDKYPDEDFTASACPLKEIVGLLFDELSRRSDT